MCHKALFGVADGARTHDNRNHNPGLYQLSYSHRRFEIIAPSEPHSARVFAESAARTGLAVLIWALYCTFNNS